MKHHSRKQNQQPILFTVQPRATPDPTWDDDDYWLRISSKIEPPTSEGNGSITGQTPETEQESFSETAHQHSIKTEDTQQAHIPCDCVGEQVISDTQSDTEKVAHQQEQDIYQTDCVGEQVKPTNKVAHQQTQATHWVERYWVERGQKYWYVRYAWMEGRKIRRIYLGSVTHPKAITLKDAVNSAIVDGQTPGEIIQMIQDFQQGLARTSQISLAHPKCEQLSLVFVN